MVTYPSEWKEKALGDFISIGRGASSRPMAASGLDILTPPLLV